VLEECVQPSTLIKEGSMIGEKLRRVYLVSDVATNVAFEDATFQVAVDAGEVRVAVDEDNYATVRHRSLAIPLRTAIQERELVEEERSGDIDYAPYFLVDWEDEMSLPMLTFQQPPIDVARRYSAGQSIELGLEDVEHYRVSYADGVEAVFERTDDGAFRFEFSTGFEGGFWRDPDGSYTLRFRGDRLGSPEEAQHSQSKFIVSRSKYSGNLLLILQDDAVVHLT
jgi:hypothetical protein